MERMGKFHRILNPGLNILTPILDRVKYVQSLKELAIEIPQQSAVTSGIHCSKADVSFGPGLLFDTVPLLQTT